MSRHVPLCTDPPGVCPGFGLDRSSTGLNTNSFVRFPGESFRTVVHDALEGKRVSSLLGVPSFADSVTRGVRAERGLEVEVVARLAQELVQ